MMSISFNHILVPYDGTKAGNKAFNGAIELAKNVSPVANTVSKPTPINVSLA